MWRNQRPAPEALIAELESQKAMPFWRTRSARLTIAALLMVLLITTLKGKWQRPNSKFKPNPEQQQLAALKRAPLKNNDEYFRRAEVFIEHSHFSEAIADYSHILKENPRSIKALTMRAESWTRLGQYLKAETDWKSILKIYPKDLTALNQLGVLHLKQGQNPLARKAFDSALRNHPQEAVVLANRGLSWLQEKNLDAAQKDLERALKLNPRLSQSHYYWGQLQLSKGNQTEALKAFNNTLILNAEFISALFDRSQILQSLGQCKQAGQDLKKACRLGDERACKPIRCKQTK